jgi:MoaA/NifB/PqqE/SkfB family radical SAM enzyme
MNYTRDDLRFLYDRGVSLLIKCDSLNPEVFGRLLGTDDMEIVKSIYRTIDIAIEIGFGDVDCRGCSRLALSIVPTQYNKEDLLEVTSFCKANQLFPLLGQVEYAGRAQTAFDTLSLSNDELLQVKAAVEAILEAPYEIPVCPAGIAGLHISNVGECIVHKGTGLSCPWFDLLEPEVESLGNVREKTLPELWEELQRYRVKRIGSIRRWVGNMTMGTLGGCGGKSMLETYLKIQSSKR